MVWDSRYRWNRVPNSGENLAHVGRNFGSFDLGISPKFSKIGSSGTFMNAVYFRVSLSAFDYWKIYTLMVQVELYLRNCSHQTNEQDILSIEILCFQARWIIKTFFSTAVVLLISTHFDLSLKHHTWWFETFAFAVL